MLLEPCLLQWAHGLLNLFYAALLNKQTTNKLYIYIYIYIWLQLSRFARGNTGTLCRHLTNIWYQRQMTLWCAIVWVLVRSTLLEKCGKKLLGSFFLADPCCLGTCSIKFWVSCYWVILVQCEVVELVAGIVFVVLFLLSCWGGKNFVILGCCWWRGALRVLEAFTQISHRRSLELPRNSCASELSR